MTLFAYVSSYFWVLAGVLAPMAIPFALVYPRFFGISRSYCLIAVMGVHVTLLYVKPAFVPLWMIPVATSLVALAANRLWKGGREPFMHAIRDPFAWAVIGYCFMMFAFRWEPPGVEPTKWGALARVLSETQRISSEVGPTSIRDLRGASLAIPLMMAMSHGLPFIPWERIVSFYECACLFLFVMSLASALTVWFSRRASLGAAFLALVLYSNPQNLLTWGGTPTLVGMIGGFALLEVTKILLVRRILFREILLFSFVLVFAAHASLPGFVVSIFTMMPIIAWLTIASNRWPFVLSGVGRTVGISLVLFAPFFLRWNFRVGMEDLAGMRRWHERMAPYLFQQDLVGGILWHLRVSLWELSLVIGVFTYLSSIITDFRQRYLIPCFFALVTSVFLLVNVKAWMLPLSYLFTPEAVSVAFVFPLSMPLAWILSKLEEMSAVAQRAAAVSLLGISVVCLLQFKQRILPHLFRSKMTEHDREAIALVETKVPWQECIEIKSGESGMWIPVLALRCVVVSSGDDTRDPSAKPKAPWVFLGDLETGLPLMGGELVFDNGARLIQRK